MDGTANEEDPMTTKSLDRVIDADGHVMEDIPALVSYLPPEYTSARNGRTPFPPLDHLHAANQHTAPEGAFAPIREEVGMEFLDDVGIESTILYTTAGLPVGNIVNKDWAVDLCSVYNDWLYDTYVTRTPRFKVMGLIQLQER